jgi:phage gp46-like protein
MTDTKQPCGIIAIMTNSSGDVIATAADFERQAPGGFKLWEGQRQRACQQVKWAAVRAYCSDVVTQAISSYVSSQIADELLRKGHKLTCRAVGYPDDVAAEVNR